MDDVVRNKAIPSATTRAARRAVLGVFFINGAIIASWVTHNPLLKEKFGLTDAQLGLVLLSAAAGSVASLLLVGGVIARLGSRLVTSITTLAICVLLPFILLAPTVPVLVAVLVLFGMFNSAMDVAMNTQAVVVEEGYDRPIMSMFHALFSIGGLVGAGVGSLVLSLGMGALSHVLLVTLLMIGLGMILLRSLLPSDTQHGSDAPVIVLPTGPLLILGVLAFCGLVAEGAMTDWSAVYLRDTLGTTNSFAAAGFAAFSFAMAVGRMTGDELRRRLRAVPLVRLSGIVGAVGLGIALLLQHPLAALIGFACVGLGMANIVPVLFSAAGKTPNVPAATGIAAVATTGYFGFLAGPPLIGFLAHATNLGIGLGTVVLVCALIALFAHAARAAD